MYGVCSECGTQEESRSAKCTGCGHNWHLFPTRPKDLEAWLRPRGPWDRARRCYPPIILNALSLGILLFISLVALDVWAIYKSVYLTRLTPFLIPGIVIFDCACAYLGLKTLRVSMKHFKRLKWVIFTSLALTLALLAHTLARVIGFETQAAATTYLAIRVILVIPAAFFFLQSRVYRALLRHG